MYKKENIIKKNLEFQWGYQGFKNIFWFCISLKSTLTFLFGQEMN